MGMRAREGVLVSIASGVQRSFCSLEVSVLETTILLNLLGFTPCGDDSDMLSLLRHCFSHIWFYGSPESPMPGRAPCHVCQLACGFCFLTSFLPALFQRAGLGSHFIKPYPREHFLNTIILRPEKIYNQDITAFQYSLDSLPGNFHY